MYQVSAQGVDERRISFINVIIITIIIGFEGPVNRRISSGRLLGNR